MQRGQGDSTNSIYTYNFFTYLHSIIFIVEVSIDIPCVTTRPGHYEYANDESNRAENFPGSD